MFPNVQDRRRVYRLTPAQAAPDEFLSYYMPHIQSKEAHSSRDKRLFYESMKLRENLMDDADEHEDDLDLDDPETILSRSVFDKPVSDHSSFDFVVASRTNPDLAWTIEKLAAKNQERYDTIERWRQQKMAEGKMSLAQIAKGAADQRRTMFKEQMAEFRVAVWSDTANVSEELKVVIKWGEKYLETHKNFYRYRPKVTKNMSTSAEWALRLTFLAEHVLYIYTHHSFLLMVLLQSMNAYDHGHFTADHVSFSLFLYRSCAEAVLCGEWTARLGKKRFAQLGEISLHRVDRAHLYLRDSKGFWHTSVRLPYQRFVGQEWRESASKR
jgi:hypothetical protein